MGLCAWLILKSLKKTARSILPTTVRAAGHDCRHRGDGHPLLVVALASCSKHATADRAIFPR